jgi:hypothetical protein
MENPATWGEAEQIVCNAYISWHAANEEGHVGLSLPRTITDALREAGLLKEGK